MSAMETNFSDINTGGVISAQQDASINITFCSFTNNQAIQGGVVYAEQNVFVTISGSNFVGNYASQGGVLVLKSACSLVVSECNFTANHASKGGIVYAEQSVTITVTDSRFDSNRADQRGGVVCARESVTITVTGSRFDGNRADSSGGGVLYAERGVTVTVADSRFDGNRANDGGIGCARDYVGLTFIVSTVMNSKASQGGVVFAEKNVIVNVTDSSFVHNLAAKKGGVISIDRGGLVSACNSSFSSNNASSFGGILFAEEGVSLTLKDSHFVGNSAQRGGVLYALQDINVSVANCKFFGNTAFIGGVFYLWEQCKMSVSQTICERNQAFQHAAVVLCDESLVFLEGGTFKKNMGTAMVLQNYDPKSLFSSFSNCLFEDNFQSESVFGDDLFSSVPTRLHNININKTRVFFVQTRSMVSTEDTSVSLLNIIVKSGLMGTVAEFRNLLWDPVSSNKSIIHLKCPQSRHPAVETGNWSDSGAGLKLTCNRCPLNYYLTIGDTSIMILMTKHDFGRKDMMCEARKSSSMKQNSLYSFCKSVVNVKCLLCPFGANCVSGVSALPNYWGFKQHDGQISMKRCLSDYCCQKSPCSGIDATDKEHFVVNAKGTFQKLFCLLSASPTLAEILGFTGFMLSGYCAWPSLLLSFI